MRAVGDGLAGLLALFPRGLDVVVAPDEDVVAAVRKVLGDAGLGGRGCGCESNYYVQKYLVLRQVVYRHFVYIHTYEHLY
jgi:hypothetical protein